MNILHINQSDIAGGAAIAGYRLHQGLLNNGINSKLLVGKVETNNELVSNVPRKYTLENQLYRLSSCLGLNYINLISSFDILKHQFYQQADILNFHNLHTGYFNYLALPSLTKNKPAVITLHDMWSFTGHCAYSYDCDRWKNGCGQCPNLNSYPAIQRDNTHWEWKLKKWVYSHSNLVVITLSKWLTEQVKQSILNRFPIHHIPNGIDTEAYQPREKKYSRNILGIAPHKKVLMFGAGSLKAIRKGGNILIKALQQLPTSLKAEVLLMTIGHSSENISQALDIETINLGYISSDRLKSVVYSAADLFVFPTRADNLPLMLQESMACGTPMVSFKVGGVPDLVRHDVTGYLATPEDYHDLCQGIIKLLQEDSLREKMSQNCRQIALTEYSLELQIKRYSNIYQQLLKN